MNTESLRELVSACSLTIFTCACLSPVAIMGCAFVYILSRTGRCDEHHYVCPPDNTINNSNYTVKQNTVCKNRYLGSQSIPARKVTTTDQGCSDSGSAAGIVSLSLFVLAIVILSCVVTYYLLKYRRVPRRMQQVSSSHNSVTSVPPVRAYAYPNLPGIVGNPPRSEQQRIPVYYPPETLLSYNALQSSNGVGFIPQPPQPINTVLYYTPM